MLVSLFTSLAPSISVRRLQNVFLLWYYLEYITYFDICIYKYKYIYITYTNSRSFHFPLCHLQTLSSRPIKNSIFDLNCIKLYFIDLIVLYIYWKKQTLLISYLNKNTNKSPKRLILVSYSNIRLRYYYINQSYS